MCPLGYMELFKASHSIDEVKQRWARLYSDGGRRSWGVFISFSTAFTPELITIIKFIVLMECMDSETKMTYNFFSIINTLRQNWHFQEESYFTK